MLVLTRKVGDIIAIGDNIKIVVMAIKGKQVRLGIQADKDTIVHREEVYQKIQQEICAAMQSNVDNATEAGNIFKNAIPDSTASNTSSSSTSQTDSKNSLLQKKPGQNSSNVNIHPNSPKKSE